MLGPLPPFRIHRPAALLLVWASIALAHLSAAFAWMGLCPLLSSTAIRPTTFRASLRNSGVGVHAKGRAGALQLRALGGGRGEDELDESLPAPVKARFLLKAAQVDLQIDLTLARKDAEWKRSPPVERPLVLCEAGGVTLVCEVTLPVIQTIESGSMKGRSWLRPLFLQRPTKPSYSPTSNP
ncbi:hypothetical protein T484DRAFT_1829749 [Baffinella frigidus]|nr:hypothetical protein T484DRAFT_1829749 [Cryptophyta sp. CCMP2293]